MPTKNIELTRPVAVRLTPALYQFVVAMRPLWGSDADVMRAAILALWREYQQIQSAAPDTPTPAGATAPAVEE